MTDRTITLLDRLIGQIDQALHTVFGPAPHAARANPATGKSDPELTAAERELSGRLMRINHVGEICAQALYQGQALTARMPEVRGKMEQAAQEENDHLRQIPTADGKSRAILEQMRDDEGRHATVAIESGGAALPEPVKQWMQCNSKVMTRTAYWI